ncbi:hypothetical protein BV20DRAFT_966327 [Pilatotrama ljubarskyi]|nr:hypothetical protein BV20DRAFT_966327 [Pilatotrama ljubarskyi]
MEQFPELKVLRIEGRSGEDLEGGTEIQDVFDGLTRLLDYDKKLCPFGPALRKLSFARVEWTERSMDAIRGSLKFRAKHGLFLEELHLELNYRGITSEDEFQVFKAPYYAELCALVRGAELLPSPPIACSLVSVVVPSQNNPGLYALSAFSSCNIISLEASGQALGVDSECLRESGSCGITS